MANEIFDFAGLKKLKLKEYKDTYCKPNFLKAGKAGLVLIKFDIKSRKKDAIYLSFKKPKLAKDAYEALKSDKNIHLAKHAALVSAKCAKGEDGKLMISINIIKGGLSAEDINTNENIKVLFSDVIKMGLNVTGASDDIAEDTNSDGTIDGEDGDRNEDGVIDESTIVELRQKFQKAQQLYKQSKSLDKSAKAEAINTVAKMFKELMPNLNNFIERSDQKAQLQTANKIKENIVKFQNALGGSDNTESNTPTVDLDELTTNISDKATELLKSYQDAITTFDEGNTGESLKAKLESISKIGNAKTA
jgi:hypothetical protein